MTDFNDFCDSAAEKFRTRAATSLAALTIAKVEIAADLYLAYRALQRNHRLMEELAVELADIRGKRFVTRFVNWWAMHACDDATRRTISALLTEIASTIEFLEFQDTTLEWTVPEVTDKIVELGGLAECHRRQMALMTQEARRAREANQVDFYDED